MSSLRVRTASPDELRELFFEQMLYLQNYLGRPLVLDAEELSEWLMVHVDKLYHRVHTIRLRAGEIQVERS